MGKDLHSHLQWLEDALLDEENQASGSQDLDFDVEDILAEFREEDDRLSLPKNRAMEYNRMAFGDEDFDESAAVTVAAKKSRKAREGKKGAGGLVIVAILEVIAILLVLLRWALWFL